MAEQAAAATAHRRYPGVAGEGAGLAAEIRNGPAKPGRLPHLRRKHWRPKMFWPPEGKRAGGRVEDGRGC